MANKGVELELKGVLEDSAAVRGKSLGSPKSQRPDYESLKEVNDINNGKSSARNESFMSSLVIAVMSFAINNCCCVEC